MSEDEKNGTILYGVRAILSYFFAFWVIMVGVHLAPTFDTLKNNYGMLVYLFSIPCSAIFIVLNGIGIFDN